MSVCKVCNVSACKVCNASACKVSYHKSLQMVGFHALLYIKTLPLLESLSIYANTEEMPSAGRPQVSLLNLVSIDMAVEKHICIAEPLVIAEF